MFLLILFSAGPSKAEGLTRTKRISGKPSMLARTTAIPLINLYQNYLSRFTITQCPSWPTCSHFSYQAITRHGLAIGVFMTVDRLIHEAGQIEQGKKVFVKGRGYCIYDPLANNDFWWMKRPEVEVPDIPQMHRP